MSREGRMGFEPDIDRASSDTNNASEQLDKTSFDHELPILVDVLYGDDVEKSIQTLKQLTGKERELLQNSDVQSALRVPVIRALREGNTSLVRTLSEVADLSKTFFKDPTVSQTTEREE